MLDIKETTSGGVGAVCLVYTGLPFDVAKVRLQTSSEYRGVMHCLVKSVHNEGARSLWKGATPALASAIIENSVLFTAQGALRRIVFGSNHKTSLIDEAMLGGAAAIFSATAITPAEVIKCRLQSSHTASSNVFACIRGILAQNGLAGFMAGLPAVLLRDIPFSFCFFGAYELYTSTLVRWLEDHSSKRDLHPLAVLTCGGAAGATGWSLVFPADVVKSYMQVGNGVGFRQAFDNIRKAQGLRGFYRGWSAAVLRSFPANGALFLGVEMTHRLFAAVENGETEWSVV
ncbi:hypothetical protein LEN26_008226 [Aphanomyces euteiches]|nr:hypothetical protein AeMF1_007321 [Aphanomyces euteiches]KAH9121669.1 hypothetical protein AeMF1_006718 [Aphanomyces euteiches]KAH9124404.1 hypothetical protein AeMF1_004817 [Aphanomyces euteiches]KAH9130007.1 hypothetical protein LEN26_008946 [Aphanomyces euteiches]KAH9130765.1 hypothetical protein LEN26_008226 [Aphanomyces euteiches]